MSIFALNLCTFENLYVRITYLIYIMTFYLSLWNNSCAAVVQSFERLSNGTFGPIQRHGGVHYGDVLFEFNDRCFFNTPLGEVLRVLNDKNISKKNAKFLNAKEYYRRK